MTLTFPLPPAAFLDLLPVQQLQLQLQHFRQINGLQDGTLITSERAPAMWRGSVSLAPMPARKAAELQALLAALEAPGRSFELFKKSQIGPAADPSGAALDGYGPKIQSLSGTGLMRLDGLPPGFEVSAGDYLAFDYDPGSGSRRAFHQVAAGQVADGTGAMAADLTVVPPVRPGAVTDAPVVLVRPALTAVLVPGSVSYGITSHKVTSGMAFEFRQVLKG